jgi:hypothetical protein
VISWGILFKGVFGSTTPCEGGTVGTSSGVRTCTNGALGRVLGGHLGIHPAQRIQRGLTRRVAPYRGMSLWASYPHCGPFEDWLLKIGTQVDLRRHGKRSPQGIRHGTGPLELVAHPTGGPWYALRGRPQRPLIPPPESGAVDTSFGVKTCAKRRLQGGAPAIWAHIRHRPPDGLWDIFLVAGLDSNPGPWGYEALSRCPTRSSG